MNVILLAAGKGTRMNGDMPKVLTQLGGKTLIEHALDHVIETKIDLNPIVVVGYKAEEVKKTLAGYSVQFIEQKEQLGTGHAVLACKDLVDKNQDVLVLYGDHAVVRPETILKLSESLKGNVMSLVTYTVKSFDEHGGLFKPYGRILRDEQGGVAGIKEAKDATADELEVKEVNPAYYAFSGSWLWDNIERLSSNNSQKEYYLTDLLEMAISQGKPVTTITGTDLTEAMGINTPEQLAHLEQLLFS